MKIGPDEIGHIIQLAIAPVFLLTGVGTNMLVLTNRLARIIDRYRALEERLNGWDGKPAKQATVAEQAEINMLFKRAQKINRAIFLSTSCALLICMVVATLFKGNQEPGTYTITWNGRSQDGKPVMPGEYIAEVRLGSERIMRKRISWNAR